MNTEILIVEDEGLIALDLKKKLEQSGYIVPEIVDNADDAIHSCERLRPSLVLMDIRLRGPRDGIETAEQIRRQFHLPVIFVTAHADRETLERARITEPFGYIVKPFRGVDFRAPIEMALWKHKMEQKLRMSEAWLSTTFRNVADALIATDSDGNVAFMNPPAARLTGWNWREAKGQPLLKVFHVFDELTGLPEIQPLLHSEGAAGADEAPNTTPRTYKLAPRGGSESVLIEAELSVNQNEGTLFGYIVIFRDITARRNAERQARQLHKMSALTVLATGLGKELAQSQEKMDASLNYLIKQAMGTNSRRLWDIYECSVRQQSVVQQLVMLGQSDAGQIARVNLNEVLTGLHEHFRKTLGTQYTLPLKLAPGIPLIRTDPSQLRENLLRLINDVRQADPTAALPGISTSVLELENGRQRAQVVIRDTRSLVAGSAKERVFDPYYQSRPGKGNPGFSLALVYQFVAMNGGQIEVETTADGSAYVLNFPVAELAASAIANDQNEIEPYKARAVAG